MDCSTCSALLKAGLLLTQTKVEQIFMTINQGCETHLDLMCARPVKLRFVSVYRSLTTHLISEVSI